MAHRTPSAIPHLCSRRTPRPGRRAPIRQLALPRPQDYQDGGCVRRRGRTAWGV